MIDTRSQELGSWCDGDFTMPSELVMAESLGERATSKPQRKGGREAKHQVFNRTPRAPLFKTPPKYRYIPRPKNVPRSGEMEYKNWLVMKCDELGIKRSTLEMRISRGTYPKPVMRKVNQRVLFVVGK